MSIRFASVMAAALALATLSHTAQAAEPLPHSTWSGTDIWNKPIAIHFGENARFAYKSENRVWPGGSWRVEGSDVYFEINNKFVEHTGTRTANEMHGNGKTKRGEQGTWQLKKLEAPLPELVAALGTTPSGPKVPAAWAPEVARTYRYKDANIRITLSCDSVSACSVVFAASDESNPYVAAHSLRPAQDAAGLQRAWDYAKTNREVVESKPFDPSFVPVRAALKPYLVGAGLTACADLLTRNNANYSVCSVEGEKDTLMLFLPLMTPCGNGFCAYAIMPLKAAQPE